MNAGLAHRHRGLLGLALVVGLVCGWFARHGGFIDLAVYRFGGATVLADPAALYTQGTPGSGLPFTYPPFAALLFAPVAAVPFPLVVAAWSTASVLVLGWVLRRFRPAVGARPWLLAGVTALALLFEPVWQTLWFGQINVFIMGLVVADLLLLDRRRAGVLIGIAAGLKLTPLLFVVFLVMTRRTRAAANAGLAFLGTIAAGFALAPEASGAYFGRVVWDAGRVGGLPFSGNQSMLAAMFRLQGMEPSTLVWFVVAGATTFGVLLVGALAWRRDERALAVGLAALAMLVASPVSWSHHWVWAAPIALALVGRSRVVALLWSAVFVSTCIWWPPHRDDRELHWGPLDHVVGNAYLAAALLLTAGLAASWLRSRTTVPGPVGRGDAPGVSVSPSSTTG